MIQTSFSYEPLTPPRTVAASRRTDPETSREAGMDAAGRWSDHRRRALQAHYAAPAGLTDFELSERTGIAQTSIGKRRLELLRLNLIMDAGERRAAPSGASAIVWRITEAGRSAYQELEKSMLI